MKKIDELTAAKIGITALIDEATGFQADRPKNALRKMAHGKWRTEPQDTA